jgi:hypothetical protein
MAYLFRDKSPHLAPWASVGQKGRHTLDFFAGGRLAMNPYYINAQIAGPRETR